MKNTAPVSACTSRNRLIESKIDFADQLAKARKRRVGANVSLDDLRSAAYYGLFDAANRYRKEMGKFKNYVAHRIKGEMTECVRQINWSKKDCAIQVCEMENAEGSGAPTGPDEGAVAFFPEVTEALPKEGQDVLRWYYSDELTMREISERLGVSESMVSHLMKKYRQTLRQAFFEKRFDLWAVVGRGTSEY